jgi:hypothetical protein
MPGEGGLALITGEMEHFDGLAGAEHGEAELIDLIDVGCAKDGFIGSLLGHGSGHCTEGIRGRHGIACKCGTVVNWEDQGAGKWSTLGDAHTVDHGDVIIHKSNDFRE